MRIGLRTNLRALRAALAPLRERGFGLAQTSVRPHLLLRFLELAGDQTLSRRYAFPSAPLRQSSEALRRGTPGDAGWQGLELANSLIERLQRSIHPRTF